MPKKQTPTNYADELRKDFDRWEQVYTCGTHDPLYTDGYNLSMVRGHIIGGKRKIEENYEPGKYPEIYYKDTPPEVPWEYMARADEIRANAKKTLAVYTQNEDYKFLLAVADKLTPKDKKATYIEAVLGYVLGLEKDIATDDLVGMRRHEDPTWYAESFGECVARVRELKPVANEQFAFLF